MNVLRNAIFTKLVLLLKISLHQRSKKRDWINAKQLNKSKVKLKQRKEIKSSVSKMKNKNYKNLLMKTLVFTLYIRLMTMFVG